MGALIPFLIVYGIVAVVAIRRPLLGRLAIREATRRKGQSMLVIAGLMVGTATVTAGLIGADSVGTSAIDSFVYRNWGHIDITVGETGTPRSRGGRATTSFFPREVAARLAADPDVAAVTDGITPGIDLFGSVSDLDQRQGASGVVLVGFDPATQAPFGSYELDDGRTTTGDDLAPGEVLISRTLANKLNAATGDRLTVNVTAADRVNRPQPAVRVAGIAKATGPGAYTLGAAVFAPLDTAQRIAGVEGVNVVRISAPGGIKDAAQEAEAAMPVLEAAAAALETPVELEARDVKAREVENTETFTSFIAAMLIGMSSIVIAAGAALIVNIMGMLAEERRSQSGVLRALGLRRKSLIGFSVIEGAIYSVIAGVLGVFVGVAFGRIIAGRFAEAFAAFAGESFDFEFRFSFEPSTLVSGFAAGTLMTLGVILVASWRTSRMTITSAIRNLPEPGHASGRLVRRIRLGTGLLAGAGLLAVGEFATTLIGAILLILVAASLLRSRLSPRLHASLLGLALAGVSFAVIASLPADADGGEFFGTFVVAMLTSVFGLTTLASGNLHVVETLVAIAGRAFAGLRAMLRPPLAYLARRPTRTGLTTGVFALIIAMLALFAVFTEIFGTDYETFGGGYDVRVLSTGSEDVALSDELQSDVRDAQLLPTLGYVGSIEGGDEFSNSERAFVPLLQVPADAAERPPIPITDRAEGYASDREVWEAVLADPAKVVSIFGTVGSQMTLQGDEGPVTFEIIGLPTFGLLDGMYASEEALESFQRLPRGASMLIDLQEGVDATTAARRIERDLFEIGVDAESVRSLLETADRAFRAIFSTIDILMRMGLVIGILALGIVALRIVTERRHAIGVLRAIGYRSRSVLAGLLTEAVTTATIGALVGTTVGVTMGYIFYRQQDSNIDFGIDLPRLLGVFAIVYLSVFVVTIVPAWRASKLPPAEAVRYTE